MKVPRITQLYIPSADMEEIIIHDPALLAAIIQTWDVYDGFVRFARSDMHYAYAPLRQQLMKQIHARYCNAVGEDVSFPAFVQKFSVNTVMCTWVSWRKSTNRRKKELRKRIARRQFKVDIEETSSP
jgi:hypothetical protein